MADNYRIRIVRQDGEFEAEGDKSFVLEMLDRFEAGTGAPTKAPKARAPRKTAEEAAGKALSVREFVQKLGVKRHTDKVLAFGYYLEHHTGKSEFTPADINNCYYEAKMETSNTSQALAQNIKRGFVMEAKGGGKKRKRYTLTQSGEDTIAKKLTEKPE